MLKELAKSHPTENYIYFADNAYMPYGSKSARSIKVRLLHLCNYLVNEFNVKLIILACHTASAVGLDYLTKQLNVPIFGLNLDKWTIGEYRIICTKLTNKYYLNSNAVACNNLAKEIDDNYFDASILNRKIMNIISKA
ncbi:MAG: hypothetical protein IJA72_04290, partial [Clostridia bacterium]|nr:hypothetical protein [Clostridia bacterium]